MKSGIKSNRVLPIFSQILDGVEAAHLQKVIHRDLKPESILFDDKSEILGSQISELLILKRTI